MLTFLAAIFAIIALWLVVCFLHDLPRMLREDHERAMVKWRKDMQTNRRQWAAIRAFFRK